MLFHLWEITNLKTLLIALWVCKAPKVAKCYVRNFIMIFEHKNNTRSFWNFNMISMERQFSTVKRFFNLYTWLFFWDVSIIFLMSLKRPYSSPCRNVMDDFVAPERSVYLSEIRKNMFLINKCFISYVFPREILIILKLGKNMHHFIKKLCFALFFFNLLEVVTTEQIKIFKNWLGRS